MRKPRVEKRRKKHMKKPKNGKKKRGLKL